MAIQGKHTAETFATELGITKDSAINRLSRLKKRGLVTVSGGGRQKRIYTITNLPQKQPNGYFTIVNKYAKKKLVPRYKHYVHGRYTIENAIVDGIIIGDVRTLEATQELFRHVKNWKRLFEIANRHNVAKEVKELYSQARKNTRTRRIPKRYT